MIYVLIGVIIFLIPLAVIGVSHLFIDFVNRLKLSEVSAGITVRRRRDLDAEHILRELMQSLPLPLIKEGRTTTRSVLRKRSNRRSPISATKGTKTHKEQQLNSESLLCFMCLLWPTFELN